MKKFYTCIKEDYKIFRLVHSGNIVLNLLYLPSFKIVLLFRLSQLFSNFKLLKPIS